MALQTGIGAGKVLILVGAGLGGSIVLRNSKLSDLLSDLSRVLAKHLQQDGDGAPGSGTETTEALTAQVRRLTYELRQLAASNRPITVVNSGPSSGGNLGFLIMPGAVIGIAGYGYMWWKGWSFSDIMYVTKRNMSNAVASMSKQMETFSAALVATRKQLTSRLDIVTRKAEQNTALSQAIQAQVGRVGDEVMQVGLEISKFQKQMEGLEGKIDEVQGKQDFANDGIILLCKFLYRSNHELLQSGYTYPGNRLDRSPSSSICSSSAGLKDIQRYTEKLMLQASFNSGDTVSNITSPSLQKSLTVPIPVMFSRPYPKT